LAGVSFLPIHILPLEHPDHQPKLRNRPMSHHAASNVVHLHDDLLEMAREKYKAMCKAGADEVRCALDFGDILIRVKKELAPKRGWQEYVKEQIGVSKTVANECIRLANHHDAIERHLGNSRLDGTAVHSVRAALRLIRKPAGASKTTFKKKAAPSLDKLWGTATPEERRAVLAKRDFEEAVTEFPIGWFQKLEDRFSGQLARLEKGLPVDSAILTFVIGNLQEAVNLSAVNLEAAGKALLPVLHELTKRRDDRGLWGVFGIPNKTKAEKPARRAA
jgi:hypothetical protein